MIELKDIQESAESGLEAAYATALQEFFADPCESTLRVGYEIGRKAIAEGVGILQITSMYHAALTKLLPDGGNSDGLKQHLQQAEEFFAESLSPYEMAHRGYREAVTVLRSVNETLELEIKRIAHTLHDEAGQLLVAAKMAVAGLAHDVPPELQGRLQEISTILDQAEQQLRRLSHELRPLILDDLGLLPAVHFLAEGIAKRSKLSVEVTGETEGRLAPAVETALYRIIQEALNNINKHAQAKNVTIQFNRDGQNVRCIIKDDGKGFDVIARTMRKGHKGLGLIGIRERLNALGGTLQVDSETARGTALLVTIPVET
ncbi:MAG TPA: sensor histidine kinase [Terriglobales bacterium]|jgi:signal transduction histidine kinase|nr:sensor histidine kinase [Terriglobales bacterium]